MSGKSINAVSFKLLGQICELLSVLVLTSLIGLFGCSCETFSKSELVFMVVLIAFGTVAFFVLAIVFFCKAARNG